MQEVDLVVENNPDPDQTPNPKSHLPNKIKNKIPPSKADPAEGLSRQDRERIIRDRRNMSKQNNHRNDKRRDEQEDQSVEKQVQKR